MPISVGLLSCPETRPSLCPWEELSFAPLELFQGSLVKIHSMRAFPPLLAWNDLASSFLVKRHHLRETPWCPAVPPVHLSLSSSPLVQMEETFLLLSSILFSGSQLFQLLKRSCFQKALRHVNQSVLPLAKDSTEPFSSQALEILKCFPSQDVLWRSFQSPSLFSTSSQGRGICGASFWVICIM